MIDGFRHGFFGQSDISPWTSLAIVCAFFAVLATIAVTLLKRGYKLRH
jgi:ABC-2 type transport system permease protein